MLYYILSVLVVVNQDYFVCYHANLVQKLNFKLKTETIRKLVRYAIYLGVFEENGVLNLILMELIFLNLLPLRRKLFLSWLGYLLIIHSFKIIEIKCTIYYYF